MNEPGGIVGSARRVFAHGAALLRLERELAKAEMQRKAGTLGAGVFTALAAALFALFAIGFGLATLAAVLALVVDWWLALLIVFVLLVLVVVGLAFASRSLFRAGTPLKPEQAIEEAQLTKERLRSVGDG
jgi:predicted Co/Zn/Cd cation transporter (cation efflux family)